MLACVSFFDNVFALLCFQHYSQAEVGLVCRLTEPVKVQADAALTALHAEGKLIRRDELTFGPLIGKGEFGEVYRVSRCL